MKKSQLEHILRAARKICEDDEFIIIGSQSLHELIKKRIDETEIDAERKAMMHRLFARLQDDRVGS